MPMIEDIDMLKCEKREITCPKIEEKGIRCLDMCWKIGEKAC